MVDLVPAPARTDRRRPAPARVVLVPERRATGLPHLHRPARAVALDTRDPAVRVGDLHRTPAPVVPHPSDRTILVGLLDHPAQPVPPRGTSRSRIGRPNRQARPVIPEGLDHAGRVHSARQVPARVVRQLGPAPGRVPHLAQTAQPVITEPPPAPIRKDGLSGVPQIVVTHDDGPAQRVGRDMLGTVSPVLHPSTPTIRGHDDRQPAAGRVLVPPRGPVRVSAGGEPAGLVVAVLGAVSQRGHRRDHTPRPVTDQTGHIPVSVSRRHQITVPVITERHRHTGRVSHLHEQVLVPDQAGHPALRVRHR